MRYPDFSGHRIFIAKPRRRYRYRFSIFFTSAATVLPL